MTNLTEIKGSWLTIKGKLKQKFAILTDSDLLLVEGKQEEMMGVCKSVSEKQKKKCTNLFPICNVHGIL